jgi:putative ABC transport system permease protein
VDVPLRVVARVKQFPGAVRGTVTIVADRETVLDSVNGLEGEETRYELWAKGDPPTILRYLGGQGFPLDLASSVTTVRSTPAFLALSWTFGLLEAFGILAGLITILGIVLYLQARQQAREVSYALARRMGLRRRAHRRSVLVELLAMLLTAFLLGGLFSTLAAGLVHGRLDPIPNLSPGPFIQLPSLLFLATAGGIILVCALGARLVQRRADHTNVAEVMRLAG